MRRDARRATKAASARRITPFVTDARVESGEGEVEMAACCLTGGGEAEGLGRGGGGSGAPRGESILRRFKVLDLTGCGDGKSEACLDFLLKIAAERLSVICGTNEQLLWSGHALTPRVSAEVLHSLWMGMKLRLISWRNLFSLIHLYSCNHGSVDLWSCPLFVL